MNKPGERLALHGGLPTREAALPYGRQCLDDDDIAAVVNVLRSDWLTCGPKVAEFERGFADFVGADEAVSVSSGTAALHAAMYGMSIGPGDEVIVPAMTFAASANAVVFQGATPVFADVDPDTLLLGPTQVLGKITPRTKAIMAVDYAGQPCEYDALRAVADRYGLALIADSCHSLGGSYKGRPVGSLADVSVFSFHPVKHITTGEGGMVTTNDAALANRMRCFRNHGITADFRQREQQGSWFYEIVDLGYNYRLTDFQCVLGMSQLRKLPGWVRRRQQIARQYDAAFSACPVINPLGGRQEVSHAYHLYVVRLDLSRLNATRAEVFAALRAEGVGVNVHYIPVHLHPFYRNRFGTGPGLCEVAESAYEQIVTLPVFPGMTNADVADVVSGLCKVVRAWAAEERRACQQGCSRCN
ncbi:MAG: UDP-4-amino-4,6-dideoxy-N-acetyl-beta-L-altrosamine transaminase [bacterium]|nr:UDP-4-amino-4,6-dideoxy-N-acetyl-beta-L-altrosamine transaminase [bacterium]